MLFIFRKITFTMHIVLTACFFLIFFSCKKDSQQPDPFKFNGPDTVYTYKNPVGNITDIGDPYILQAGGKYYLYATSSGEGFKVWESVNMVDWSAKGMALNKFDTGNNWGKGNFWAPEVKYYKGKFYMSYSAIGENDLMKIRIASSDSPLGPFINYSNPFFNDDKFSYIDADLFIDGDKVYLFYVKDCSTNAIANAHVSQVYVTELKSDLTDVVGMPSLVVTPDQNWEGLGGDWQWNEGPFVMKYNSVYYVFYSANFFASRDYSVGVASAASPFGPWTKYSGNPVLKQNPSIGVSGPGHCMVTMSPDSSEYFIVYHTHTYYDNPGGNRNVCIDRLVFDNNIPKVIGPTRSDQPLPKGVKYRIIQ